MNKKTKILEISKKLGLSHIGSNISILSILEEIYSKKKPKDLVLLDGAHAHLSHLMFTDPDHAEELIKKYGIHCDRRAGCDANGGSLGHACGIAIGMALVDKKRTIYVIISDGSSCEGTLAESLRIIKMLGIKNIKIYANFNGYTAVEKVDINYWEQFIKGFGVPVIFHRTNNGEGFEGVEGHYKKL